MSMRAKPANAPKVRHACAINRGVLLTASLLPALPTIAQLGVGDLFRDSLTGGSPAVTYGFHDERFLPNANASTADREILPAFGLGGLATVPPPGDTGSAAGAQGLIVKVNRVDNLAGDAPERVAVNISPNVTLNSATQNWVMTVNAYAYNTGGTANTTLSFLAGMSSDASRVNWQGGTNTDGVFWSLTTDGKATQDLLSYQGNINGPATAFAIRDIDGNPADVNDAPPGLAGRWVTLAVGSHSNTPFFAVRTHEPDGFPNAWQVQESFANAGGPTVGRAWFGVEDPFNSANPDVGVIFRNAAISTLKPGDTDLDGDVDFADAMALRHAFSGSGVAADTGGAVASGFDANLWLWTVGDFDQDRDVDFADALQLVANYGGAGNAISPPGTPPGVASLLVDVVTGELTVESDALLSGIAITGENLAGTAPALDLALAADADAFVAISLQQDYAGNAPLGVRTSGFSDQSVWSFRYGVGGEAFVGEVRFVPEPGLALLSLAAAATLRRRQRV